MFLKKLLPFLLTFISFFSALEQVQATHVMGGEIIWECQPNGQYIFTLRIYRDCNGVAFNTNNHALQVHNYPNTGNISQIALNFISVSDITAACEGSPCATLTQADPDIPGAIEEYVLRSNPITLNGIPPANGWVFTWTYGDRNAAIDNIVNAQNFGITLRAKMFPYNGQNANNCFDSSPNFFQKPSTIICASKEFVYNHSAFDNELDSLSYEWARPLDGNFCNPTPCVIGGLYQENINPPFLPLDASSGFSYLSPFPDINLDNRNVPAVLDPETGEITFTSYNQGEYISVIKVSAWRCGQKIAEVYRELQTVITAGCAPNEPPQVVTSFAGNVLRDTVKVGDFVDFNISIIDSLRAGNPKDDSLYIFASGLMFGNNFTDSTNGCPNPPCATLSRPTPDTGFSVYATRFRWRTNCVHIANYTPVCDVNKNTYLFTIRAFDDYCPAAGQTITSIAITLLADSLVVNPEIYCADVQNNGDVNLSWADSPDPDSAFFQWKIYSATNRAGPYTLIDSVANLNQTNYSHLGAGADLQSMHYIVRAESGCNDGWTILETDTISTIFQEASFNNSCVELSWNPLNTPWPSGSDTIYNIYREYPIGSGFNLFASSSTESFCDTFNICTDTVTYRIELVNGDNSCVSNSNIAGIRFAYPDPTAEAGNDLAICDGQSTQLGGAPTSNTQVSYSWMPGLSLDDDTLANPIASPSDTTIYYVSITDEKGCTAIDSITVNTRERPIATAGVDTNVCIESFPFQLYGSVSISNSGRWIGGNGTFTPNRNSLSAVYTPSAVEIDSGYVDLQLTSESIGICDPDTDQVRITIVRFTGNPIATLTDVSCFGANDGAINVSPGGGFTPYVYAWSDGPTSQNRSNLGAGTFTVTMTNTLGCDSVLSFTINEPTQLTSTISASTDASCNGLNDGSATVTANGGTAPYTYLWNDPLNTTTPTVSGLTAGNYQVTVSDQNGCTLVNAAATIGEPDLLIATATLVQNVSCFNGSDGAALASATGGTLPYTYQWDNPLNTTTAALNNLTAANYKVTISDANGCSDTASVIISQPTVLLATISANSDASCNGLSDGSATVGVSGGTSPYTYLWNDPANSSTATVNNLAAGTYSVTVTDNQGCTDVRSVGIGEPAVLASVLAGQTNVSCNGLNDGEAFVSASGGTLPYTYLWNDPANTTADTVRNLTAGTYTVTISDSNACNTTTNVSISEPAQLIVDIVDSTDASCFGFSDGRARASISGGSSPYFIQWSDGPATTVDSARNLAAGTYFISVTDAQACFAVDSVVIGQPDSLIVTVNSSANLSCFNAGDGSASIQIQGGSAPYSILWDDPSNSTNDSIFNLSARRYRVIVTDQNSCTDTASILITEPQPLSLNTNLIDSVSCFGLADGRISAAGNGGTLPYTYQWSDASNASSDTVSNLPAGLYYVILTDNNGCTITDSVEVGQSDSLIVSLDLSQDISCFGGSDGRILTNTQGGTLPFTYNWNNNTTADSLNGVLAGNYLLTVTDARRCADTFSIRLNEPLPLSSTIDSTFNVSCNGLSDGLARVAANGGTLPYTYQWNDPNYSTTAQIGNLAAGQYYVTITDANQCSVIDSLVINQPAVLATSNTSAIAVSCFGLADGTASINVIGGTIPYTYAWSNASDSSIVDGLAAGNYYVTVTDSNGCTLEDSVLINQPSQLSLLLDPDSVSCNGFNDGSILSQVSGGIAPYTYDWSNNQSFQNLVNLSPGDYFLTVTDANGCTLIDSSSIAQPDSILLNLTNDDTICVNSPKLLVAAVSGGVGNYQYTWNQGLTNAASQSVSPTQSTTYIVSVTDGNNCPAASASVNIGVRNIYNENVNLNSTGVLCLGDTATLTPVFDPSANAIGPFAFVWNQGLSGTSPLQVSPTVTTLYTLSIIDGCSNSITDSLWQVVSPPPAINLNDSLIEGCSPLEVNFDNGSPAGYTHFWDFGDGNSSNQANPTHTYFDPGNYLVGYRVQNLDGCESEFNGNFEIEVFPSPLSQFQISPEVTEIENPTVQAFADVNDASSFFWTFGDGDSAFVAEPAHAYSDTGRYTIALYKENSFGCRDTAYRIFRVEPSYVIKIPNVFIPNQNGSNGGSYDPNNPNNAVFFPFVEFVDQYRLSIFNRWGELVFESKDQNVGWDGYYKGELCQSDVYVYKLELRFNNGQEATKVGDVTLLR